MSTTPPEATWINRVTALLAKAEATPYAEEAEAFMAKAQELMTRHAIDEAMLAASGAPGRATADQIASDAIVIDAPYASAKATLLGAVAAANGSRCVMGPAGRGAQRCVVVGHESDLANVRTLFATLSMHAVRTMLAAPVPPRDTVRRFRHAFLLAFAARIGERLREAEAVARRQAEADRAATRPGTPASAGGSVGLVLADRAHAVDAAFKEAFPRVRTHRSTSSSAAGWAGGRRAADQTGLGGRAVGQDRSRRSLR